jgi:hypothetical protein
VDIEPGPDELEDMLRRLAARLEPVPQPLQQAAAAAFAWRDIDSDLAGLEFDSLLAEEESTLVRGPQQQQRLVSFKAAELTIEVEVTSTGSARAVLGQITPPRRATVEIRTAQGTVTVEADEWGRFQSGSLRGGPMSLRLSLPAGVSQQSVVTDWVCI